MRFSASGCQFPMQEVLRMGFEASVVRRTVLPLCLVGLFASSPARAVSIDFEGPSSLTAASSVAWPGGATIVDALVLDEADALVLTGLDTSDWATSGDQGILNSLVAVVEILFATPVTSVALQVTGLPGSEGDAVPVVLQGWLGDDLGASDVSDTSGAGGDAVHQDALQVDGLFDRVVLFAATGPCDGVSCTVGPTTSFFADDLSFAVPEPRLPLLLGLALAGGLALRRRRGAALLAMAALLGSGCVPRPGIVAPVDGSAVAHDATTVPIEIQLPGGWDPGTSVLNVNLLTGSDDPPAQIVPISDRFVVAGGTATAALDPAVDLRQGRNTLFENVDLDGDGASENVSSASFSFEPTIDLTDADRCDWLDPAVCLYPFPNDFFTVEDLATDTDRRVNFQQASMPANKDGARVVPTEWNRNDGFSPGQAVQLMVPEAAVVIPDADPDVAPTPLPGAAPEWDVARSLAPDAQVVLVNAATGERVPYWMELSSRTTPAQGVPLLIRPAVNFESGQRYLVALRNLRRADSSILPAPRAFELYRDGIPTFLPEVEARRPKMEGILQALESHGVPRHDLYLAWDFTVLSKRSMGERMLAIRDDAFARLGADVPSFTVDSIEQRDWTNPERAHERVRGTIQVPLYVTNGGETGGPNALTRLHCTDSEGASKPFCEGDELPEWTGETMAADFLCNVPRSISEGSTPARMSLYGHGLLGSEGEAGSSHVSTMANEQGFIFCATRWIGMGEEDILTVGAILNDFSRFPTLPDRMHQGLLNFLFLGRAMIHPNGFGAHPAFENDDGVSLVDGSDLFYDGNSQGAIAGGALAAFAQDYTRAVLGVPGMNYSTLLFRSVDFDFYLTLLQFNYFQQQLYPLMFGLAQMLWDRSEANGHANHLTGDVYAGTPAKKILLHVAFGDFQVSDTSAQVQARTIGASMHRPGFDPAVYIADNPDDEPRPFWQVNPFWDIPGIPASDPGSLAGIDTGNLQGDPTYRFDGSAMIVWDSGNKQSTQANFPPTGGNPELQPCAAGRGGDPHECPRRQPASRIQKSEFLKTGGSILDVCGGDVCLAPDNL